MVQEYNNDTEVFAYYDEKSKSTKKHVLASGETVSSNEFYSNRRLVQYRNPNRYGVLNLFNFRSRRPWHVRAKNRMDYDTKQRHNRHNYERVSLYHSVYKTPEAGQDNKDFALSKLNDGSSIDGCWAQITYNKSIIPGSMYIRMRNDIAKYYNPRIQQNTVKKLAILGSEQGDSMPDENKRFDLITRVDYETTYSQEIEIEVKSISGGRVLSNGATVLESIQIFYRNSQQPLDTIKCPAVGSLKKKYNVSYIGLRNEGIRIDYINAQYFEDMKHGIKLVSFTVNKQDMIPYLKFSMTEKAIENGEITRFGEHYLDWSSIRDIRFRQELPIPKSDFKIKDKPYLTYRLVVEELYGGNHFGLDRWYISGEVGEVAGFTNNNTLVKNNASNIFSPLYRNTPEVSGISLIEGYSQYAFDSEEKIINLLNQFNEAYAKYIKCNGLHLTDPQREQCNPDEDYYRLPHKVVIKFTVANGLTSGSNEITGFSFIGIGDGENEEKKIGTGFNTTNNVNYPSNTSHTITLIGDKLNGMENFAGQVTKLQFDIGISKIELTKLNVEIHDNRGFKNSFIDLQASTAGQPISDSYFPPNNNSDAVLVTGTPLKFYDKGIDVVENLYSQLRTEIELLENQQTELNNTINLDQYNAKHSSLKDSIKNFNDLRYDLDTKLRELYMIEGSTSASKKLEYDGTMFSGILWSVLATTVLYYTLYELD